MHTSYLKSTGPLALLLLALTACGGQGQEGQPTASTGQPAPEQTSEPAQRTEPAPLTETALPTAEATATSITDIRSPDSLTVLVNKTHPLSPLTYAPSDLRDFGGVELRSEAADAAEKMFAAANARGISMTALSGYRSYDTQRGTYSSWAATYGQEQADVASARPGYSEHQTGLALDIGTGTGCDLQVCFKDTDAAVWAAEHAHEYGFVLRYPWWHHDTTGYWYESWHFRYVGVEEAAAFQRSDAETLEDFWGADPAPSYTDE